MSNGGLFMHITTILCLSYPFMTHIDTLVVNESVYYILIKKDISCFNSLIFSFLNVL